MKSSIRALNRLMTQAMLASLFIVMLMILIFPPTVDAGNRLVARSCDAGVATIIAPVQAYTAPSCSQNAPLQQRELGTPTHNACPQAQAAAAIDYGEVQRYTIVPQVQRYQVQRIQSPRASKVLLLQDNHNHHHHQHAAALQQRQRNQVHHHNVAAIRVDNRQANRATPNRTVTKTVTRSSRR
jgi:hypothetical protein